MTVIELRNAINELPDDLVVHIDDHELSYVVDVHIVPDRDGTPSFVVLDTVWEDIV
jgi:hypothetical protein